MNGQGNAASDANAPVDGSKLTQGNQGLDLSSVFAILLESYRLILVAGVLGLLLGVALALISTPQYRAWVLLQFDSGSTDLLDTDPNRSSRRAGGSNQEAVATQIGLLHSESLAKQVAQDLNLVAIPAYGGESGSLQQRTGRAAVIVMDNTEAESIKGSTLIRVSAVSEDPVMAARIANAMARGHISASLERKFEASSYARKFLSDQLTRTKTALEESELNLNNYAINAGIFRSSSKDSEGKVIEGASLAQADLAKLNEALKQAEIDRIAAEQRYKEFEVDFAGSNAANVGLMIQLRAQLQADYDEKSKIYKPDYPSMLALKAQIDRLDSSINSERKRSTSAKRAELYGEYKAAVRIEAELRQRVAEAKGEVVGDRERSIQYNILQREADTNRALYDALLQRYKEVGVAGGIGQSEITLVDEAAVPEKPFRPRPLINALVGLIAGLSLGVGLALALHILFDTIAEPRDVRNKLHLPVLGTIPTNIEDNSPIESLSDRKSDISEAYHSVRTALKFARPEGLPKSLLVSSTRPGEGKSTSAYALAHTMARLGQSVLLIDADLRKPTFVSSRKNGQGLGRLLASEEPISSAIEKTKTDNLSLLPAGQYTGSAAELLSSARLPQLIAEATKAFDIVVIDAPPVLGLADAPLLASTVEATVLVIESRRSRTHEIQDMVRRLVEADAKIAGVIITKMSQKRSRYGYGYGYYGYAETENDTPAEAARRIDA